MIVDQHSAQPFLVLDINYDFSPNFKIPSWQPSEIGVCALQRWCLPGVSSLGPTDFFPVVFEGELMRLQDQTYGFFWLHQ
jgi:hypothetical protein